MVYPIAQKGNPFSEKVVENYSFVRLRPRIEKPAGVLAGISSVHGDAFREIQRHIIDILVEIGARYKQSYRDMAHLLLMCIGCHGRTSGRFCSRCNCRYILVATIIDKIDDRLNIKEGVANFAR